MKTFLEVTDDYALIPVDEAGRKYVYNRKVGDKLSCEIKIARSYPQLQRFMKFIQIAFDMQDFYDSKEAFRYWLVMKSGFFATIQAPNGAIMFKPESLAFESMEEERFMEVFSACIDTFLKHFGKDQTESDILQVIGFV